MRLRGEKVSSALWSGRMWRRWGDVAAPNKRAIRCYEECGFKPIGSHYRGAGSDERLTFLKDERCRDIRRFFKKERGRNLILF